MKKKYKGSTYNRRVLPRSENISLYKDLLRGQLRRIIRHRLGSTYLSGVDGEGGHQPSTERGLIELELTTGGDQGKITGREGN